MPYRPTLRLQRDYRLLRLETLLRLRWFMVGAQAILIAFAQLALGLDLPLGQLAMVLGAAIVLNTMLQLRTVSPHRMEESAAFVLLGADILQLGALFYFTGGVANPFALFFLAPVLFSATALPRQRTIALGALAMATSTLILPFHEPLRMASGDDIVLPRDYATWVWIALQGGIIFIGTYAWRVAEEARQLVQALATTELVMERERRLSALDGLAAAAAHELGTPLATIAIVAGELLRSDLRDDNLKADILLIKEQSARCRQILAQIPTLGEPDEAPFRMLGVSDLVAEVAQNVKDRGAPVLISSEGPQPEPRCLRNPGLLYGLGNIVQNAAEFARSEVQIAVRWDAERVTITISDDGPGIPDAILVRLGEPYVTSRPWSASKREARESMHAGGGMGLGLFIARVLLERNGAELEIGNRKSPDAGATICLTWPRNLFEADRRT
ncbi:BaeS Signal transduction histidine kinase [Rhabdaerophilaceae bacterium]